jgi:phosphate binding protein
MWQAALSLILTVLSITGCGKVDKATSVAANGKAAPATSSSPPTKSLETGCVLPTLETIENGTYSPLSRPLFLHVNKKALARPEVAAFLSFYLSEGQELVSEVGYIRLNETVLNESRQMLAGSAKPSSPSQKLEGKITIDGSSTVFPITQAAAEEFQKKHPGVQVPVASSGTGGGFKKFVVGETDINDSSRPISEKEIAQCREHGIEYLELKVAIDGLTVVINNGNTWCTCLSVEQLKEIWKPDSQVKNWSDLNPEWPAKEIKLYGAGPDSGTFDYFTEVIVGKAKSSRTDYEPSEDDNQLVTGVVGDKFSLGYFGFSYYIENKSKLQAVGIIPAKRSEKK